MSFTGDPFDEASCPEFGLKPPAVLGEVAVDGNRC
jgi:hypothetical protein